MPARLQSANNATTTLSAAMASTDTSLTVASASGFPAAPFRITIDTEIIEVGAVSSNTFSNLIRGSEGTTAASHAINATVENRWTAGTYGELAGEYVGTVAPANPPSGLQWIDTSQSPARWKYYNGTSWVDPLKYQ